MSFFSFSFCPFVCLSFIVWGFFRALLGLGGRAGGEAGAEREGREGGGKVGRVGRVGLGKVSWERKGRVG